MRLVVRAGENASIFRRFEAMQRPLGDQLFDGVIDGVSHPQQAAVRIHVKRGRHVSLGEELCGFFGPIIDLPFDLGKRCMAKAPSMAPSCL